MSSANYGKGRNAESAVNATTLFAKRSLAESLEADPVKVNKWNAQEVRLMLDDLVLKVFYLPSFLKHF
jgi:hypothetical protein